jgi:hypothetical protein
MAIFYQKKGKKQKTEKNLLKLRWDLLFCNNLTEIFFSTTFEQRLTPDFFSCKWPFFTKKRKKNQKTEINLLKIRWELLFCNNLKEK